MVNLIMRVNAGDETATMSRSFLLKKYSHCPLKKRPVQFVKEENNFDDEDLSDDNYSKFENSSTKPQDLSCKTITPQPAVALISIKKENEDAYDTTVTGPRIFNSDTTVVERSYGRLLAKSGPLEPLNLNTSIDHDHLREPTPRVSRPRAVPAHYPPHYLPLNYIHPPQSDALPAYYSSPSPPKLTAIEPVFSFRQHPHRDASSSPPCHAFAPFQSRRQQNIPVIAALPYCPPIESRLYRTQPGEYSPLSPTSTVSSTNSHAPYYSDPISPPPVSPEDLSSPSSGSENGFVTIASSRRTKAESSPIAVAPQRYKCTFCAKSYSTFSGLSKHQQFHCTANDEAALKKKFKCKYCAKEYNSMGALKMHIRTHTLPCKCLQCGKAFSRPWLLQGHIRTHTGEKPFTCPHCNRAFADRSNLRAHLQTHSDVKKYSCVTCGKTFSRMSLLSKHTDGGCQRSTSHASVTRVTDDIKSFYLD